MALTICIVSTLLMSMLEFLWYLSGIERKEREYSRYQRIEHPRRMTSDRYLDQLS